MATGTSRGRSASFSASRTKLSVSRPAVPLPTAMALIPPLRTSSPSTGTALALPDGDSRWMTPLPTYFPDPSITASLHPVLIPGSMPRTALGPKGAESSNLRTFSAKTPMAASSATARNAR